MLGMLKRMKGWAVMFGMLKRMKGWVGMMGVLNFGRSPENLAILVAIGD